MLRMGVDTNIDVSYGPQERTPFWVACDGGQHLYVTTDENDVDVYDTTTMARVNHVLTGGLATDVVRSPDGRYVFASVAAAFPGVMVIDPRTLAPVRYIETPSHNHAMATSVAVNHASTRMYVSLSTATTGEVAEVDTVAKKVLRRCPVGPQPLGLALSPDDGTLYVANNRSASVSLIDIHSMTEVARTPVGKAPLRVAVTPAGQAYVTCRDEDAVFVISGRSTTATRIPVEAGPAGIAISADGRHAFVANAKAGTISILSTERDVVEHTTYDEPNCRPFGVAIGP
jgi:YVTN family beta-propeller protein